MSKDRDRTRLIQRDRTPKHLIAWDKNSPKTKQIQEQSHRGIGIQSPTRSYLLSHHLSAILAIAICCYHQDERDREWCGGRKRDVPCASSMDGWLRQVLSEVERGGGRRGDSPAGRLVAMASLDRLLSRSPAARLK